MSASERLRLLAAPATELGLDAGAARWKLADALPLIADCIALAEDVAQTDKPLWGTKDGVGFKLQNALADLNEHLEGGDVT